MSPQDIFLTLFFVTLAGLFLGSRLSVDLVALCGVLVLVFGGFLAADEALIGFSSPAVVTMVATFVLGTSLAKTGVVAALARRVSRMVGRHEKGNIFAVLLIAGLVSSVMNNVAAVALLLPLVMSLAQRSQISPSKLLMPLAFGAVLGGACTVIGNPANILAAEYLLRRDMGEVQFFDFAKFGLPFYAAGVVAILLLSRTLLPAYRESPPLEGDSASGLVHEYQSREKLLSFRVPPNARMVGTSLEETDFGGILDAQVSVIARSAKTLVAPSATEVIRAHDTLIARVHPENVERMQALASLQFVRPRRVVRGKWASSVAVKLFRCGEELEGATLRDLKIRSQFGIHCVAIRRDNEFLFYRIAGERFQVGDVLLFVAQNDDAFVPLRDIGGLEESSLDDETLQYLDSQCCLIARRAGFEDALPLRKLALGEMFGVHAFAYVEGEDVLFLDEEHESISSEQQLLVFMKKDLRRKLEQLSELEIETSSQQSLQPEQESGLFEAVIAPRSRLVGRSLREIGFRQRYGLQVVGIWRAGRPVTGRLSNDRLTFGDALLLQGPDDARARLMDDADFLVLEEGPLVRLRRNRAAFSIAGFLVMVLLSVFQLQPVHVAAFAGAMVAVVGGAVRLDEAYREIEWKVVMLIAALIPLGLVVERSGFIPILAEVLVSNFGALGLIGFLLSFAVVASVVSQSLDNSVALIMLAPLVVEVAPEFGVEPATAMLYLAVATSLAFLTPFSHKAYLLVMSAGGYRTRDYFKLGSFVTVCTFAALVVSGWVFM